MRILGVPKYRYGEVEDKDQVGVVTGFAWTDVGGELLTIEAAMMQGKGRMTVTGNVRDVMKEFGHSWRRRLTCACARSPSALSRPCLTSATSTCTCRKAQPRRTDPPPARRSGLSDMMLPSDARGETRPRPDGLLEIDLHGHRNGNGL